MRIENCTFSDIQGEHAIYLHNGGDRDTIIRDCKAWNLGRTFFQWASRESENGGRQPTGELILKDNRVHMAGLADGGAAITISGHRGPVRIIENRVTCTEKGNALVLWPEYHPHHDKHGRPNGMVHLEKNEFLGKDCARPLVRISGVEYLTTLENTFQAGANRIAVDLNPPDGGMAGDRFPAVLGKPNRHNVFEGRVVVGGTVVWESDS